MKQSTESLIEHGLQHHLIRDSDLAFIFGGSPARRYALVNKALKAGELIRLTRGMYLLADKYHAQRFSQYYLANRLVPHSIVSAESALSFHGWIPERIVQTTSVTATGKSKIFHTPVGTFTYRKVPITVLSFMTGVDILKQDKHYMHITTPLRAIVDYVYWHKVKNGNCDFLINSLRIEKSHLTSISAEDIRRLQPLYRNLTVKKFLLTLLKELHGQ